MKRTPTNESFESFALDRFMAVMSISPIALRLAIRRTGCIA
jgi:hypothetical protein